MKPRSYEIDCNSVDRKFGIVAVVSRDPTIDLAELGRRRIYLCRDTSIVGPFLLLSLPFASRCCCEIFSRTKHGRGGQVCSGFLSLSLFTMVGAFIKHSPFIFLLKSLAPSRFGAAVCGPPARPLYTGGGSNSRSKGSKP